MSGKIPMDYGENENSYDSNGIEATGVFSGILQEDMIDTVRRTHKPFIDVLVTGHFNPAMDYPLTYVPLGFNTLPLRKGQEVLVQFNQDNPRYPVLYKIPQAYTEGGVFLKNVEMPDSTDNIDIPATDDARDIFYFNENFQVVATEDYLVFRQKDYMTIYEKERFTVEYPTVQVHASKELVIESDHIEVYSKGASIDATTGKVNIQNSAAGSLGKILDSLLQVLGTTVPTTQGTSTAQSFNPAITTAITTAKTKLSLLLDN